MFKEIKNFNILLVGDFFLDEYLYGIIERTSPEAPVPILKVLRKTYNLGGAGNVLNNLTNIGCKVTVFGNIGKDVPGKKILTHLKKKNIDKDLFQVSNNIKTIVKSRVVNKNRQIIRIDDERVQHYNNINQNLKKKLLKKFKNLSLVIISDYGKGFCSSNICKFIISTARKKNIKIIVDPRKNFNDYNKYINTDFITPNLNELKLLFPNIKNRDKDILFYSRKIIKKFNIPNIIATRSEKGLTFTTKSKNINAKIVSKKVFDVAGAGDTVVAVFSILYLMKKSVEDCLKIANKCAGFVISKKGTKPIEKNEFIKALN